MVGDFQGSAAETRRRAALARTQNGKSPGFRITEALESDGIRLFRDPSVTVAGSDGGFLSNPHAREKGMRPLIPLFRHTQDPVVPRVADVIEAVRSIL